jgi:Protein of unknown function (DUF4435)
MSQKSIRELDSLPDRIKFHRQADRRGILVVEGPSDERFVNRLASGRWAIFPAGTRNIVISTVKETVRLSVDRTAGLIDQDFDDAAEIAREEGLPIFWYDTADLEGFLILSEAFDNMISELASEQKLSVFGGVSAVRDRAISSALEIAALRAANCVNKWGLPFDSIDLSRKIDRDTLSLKRLSYCQSLTEPAYVDAHHGTLDQIIKEELEKIAFGTARKNHFSGKDALAVVGIALKNKIGSCEGDVTKADHLARVLRLSATIAILDLPPLSDIRGLID